MNNLLSVRLQIDILRIQIACAAAKEYDAPWLEKSKSVMRDATGKFASKGVAIADDIKSTAKALKDATAISADVVSNLVKDKDFRHRAGLEPGLPGAKAIERVLSISKLSPGLEKKIDKWINEISQELADTYGEDGDALHQAIRKGGAPLPKNAGLKDKLEFAAARYKAYEDALKDPEKYAPTPKEQTDLVGGAINSAVPIAVSMAIALTTEIALPLLTKDSIKWGQALTSAAVGIAVDLAVQKGLDAAEIENPAIRGIASLTAGILAASAVSVTGKKIKISNEITKEAEKAFNSIPAPGTSQSKELHNLSIQTRGTTIDYAALNGGSLTTAWHRRYNQFTRYEAPTAIIESTSYGKRIYLGGINTSRKDRVNTVIRSSFAVDIPTGADPEAYFKLIYLWVKNIKIKAKVNQVDNTLPEIIDKYFDVKTVDKIMEKGHINSSDDMLAEINKEINDILLSVLEEIKKIPTLDFKQNTPNSKNWAIEIEQEGEPIDQWLSLVQDILYGKTSGRALWLNLAGVDDLEKLPKSKGITGMISSLE